MQQSAVSYFADAVLSPVLAIGLSAIALAGLSRFDILAWLVSVVAGGVAWTLFEYIVHRALYHRVSFLQYYHDAHHANPRAYLGSPPGIGTGLIFLVAFLPTSVFAPILANGLTVGMLVGYTAYQLVHHACHFAAPRSSGYLQRLRLHHAVHHYHPEAGNFGVTTPFWDWAFGTQIGRRAKARSSGTARKSRAPRAIHRGGLP
jgi:sterol desaturase/sphingolipid hydroxylase (fatty acid hydroxylase superfamily)